MARAYPPHPGIPGRTAGHRGAAPRRGGHRLRTRQGPGALRAAPGPWSVVRRRGRQFFLAGTAVGSAGLAERARVTRAEVALAGEDVRAAGVVFLAGAAALTVVDFSVTGVAPEFGASTAFSAFALVVSATSSIVSSALVATLLALAAVFCATEVALLEASTTVSAVSSSTSSRAS